VETLALILYALLVAAAVVALVLLPPAMHIRRTRWIATHPVLTNPSPADLPPGIRSLLERVAGPLTRAGFVAAESAHAPLFASSATWTQVLFLNRTTGERASVLGFHERGVDAVDLIFATDWPGRPPVLTSGVQSAAAAGRQNPRALLDAVDVPALLSRHRERTRAAAPDVSAPGSVPQPGTELAWLAWRAVIVAEEVARRAGFVGHRRRGRYRLPWRTAVRIAAHTSIRRRKSRQAGFDVILTPPANGSQTGPGPRGSGSPSAPEGCPPAAAGDA
jgi:hypothetical protein